MAMSDDFNPRNWNGRAKRIAAIVTIVSGVLVVSKTWDQMDLPRPAWSGELDEVLESHIELKSTVLNDILLRKKQELSLAERQAWEMKKQGEKVPRWLDREIATLETQISGLERRLKRLGEDE